MRTRTWTLLVAGVLVAATGACANDAPGSATDGSGQEEATTAPSPTGSPGSSAPDSPSLPTMQPPKGPPSQASDTFKEVTLTGTITTLEADCVVLTADTGVTWSLLGALTDALEVGQAVSVTGMAVPVAGSQVPTCDGAPLSVTVVTPLG